MEKQTENNKTSFKIAILNGCIAIITTALTVFFGSQYNQLQNQTQQLNVNIINTLGEDATNAMRISEDSDIEYVTGELARAYLSEVDKTEQMQKSQDEGELERQALQNEISSLKQVNETLSNQVSNLKSFILDKYSSNEIDNLISKGFVKEVAPTRLDSLEYLDGENNEKVATVRDLYGTTHSVSYRMHARNEGGYAWAKFKLDGQYDRFTANIVTSEDTARDACISVEIYVDGNIVSRADDIIRDETVRTISANVNGGNVLMIKVIGTADTYNNICFISDAELTQLV